MVKKSMSMQIAEVLAMMGWELYKHDTVYCAPGEHVFRFEKSGEYGGTIHIHESKMGCNIITYVGVSGVPDGYFDLDKGCFVEC